MFLRSWVPILKEAIASSASQPVMSIVSIVIVAGMSASIILTTGRTVGSEQSVLASIDSAGTRSIVVQSSPEGGLTSDVLGRIANMDGIGWAGAFGAAEDGGNAYISGSGNVPIRTFWTSDAKTFGISSKPPGLWASAAGLRALGMSTASGSVQIASGPRLGVVGQMAANPAVSFLEPLVVNPQPSSRQGPISVLVLVATKPELVAPLAVALKSVLGASDPSKVSVSTSEQLATLRSLVQGQLGEFGRSLILAIFAVTGVLVAAILYAFVTMRRKDFGRRRALGASRSLLVGLVLLQVFCTALIGAAVGETAALVALVASKDPLPSTGFVVSIAVLCIAVTVASACVPAVSASRRDPLKELRVP